MIGTIVLSNASGQKCSAVSLAPDGHEESLPTHGADLPVPVVRKPEGSPLWPILTQVDQMSRMPSLYSAIVLSVYLGLTLPPCIHTGHTFWSGVMPSRRGRNMSARR